MSFFYNMNAVVCLDVAVACVETYINFRALKQQLCSSGRVSIRKTAWSYARGRLRFAKK